MDIAAALQKAISIAGSEAKLGKGAGVSQNAIWQAKRKKRVSPELAIGIHRATHGEVPASILRPDLWRRPEDVPTPNKEGGS